MSIPGSATRVPLWQRVAIPAAVLLVVFVVHALSPIKTSWDSKWSIPTAQSIIREHNTRLDEYAKETAGDYAVARVRGHIYNAYPLGPALVALPFVYTLDLTLPYLMAASASLRHRLEITTPLPYTSVTVDDVVFRHHAYFEKVIASFVIALTAVLIFLVARQSLSVPLSLLATGIFAFGTAAWSSASRALWQHGPSMLMLTTTLYLLVLSKRKESLARYASLPLAFSYVIRPTNSISVALLTVYVFLAHRKQFPAYLLWSLPIAVPFLVYNWGVYHQLLPPYYTQRGGFSTAQFWVALAGQFISPARGLFIYSPVLVFSTAGVVWKIKDNQMEALDYFLICITSLTVLVHSFWSDWWGGTVYGPRLLSDMIPFLIYLLLPALSAVAKARGGKRVLLVSTGSAALLISGSMHYRGATSWKVYQWWSDPCTVSGTERLWDWRDAPFLRGILPSPGDPALRRVGGGWEEPVITPRFGREWGLSEPDADASHGEAWVGPAEATQRGVLVFGPYLSAPSGAYEATFRVKLSPKGAETPVTFDVFCSGDQWNSPLPGSLASMTVDRPTFGYENLALQFSVPRSLAGHFVGTRVTSNAPGVEIRLDKIGIHRLS